MQIENEPLITEEELQNIRNVKLTNGDDIIGIIMAFNDNVLIIKWPTKIVNIQRENTISTIMVKWQPYSMDESHTLQMSSLISLSIPSIKVVEYYLKSIKQQREDEITESNGTKEFQWPSSLEEDLKNPLKIN